MYLVLLLQLIVNAFLQPKCSVVEKCTILKLPSMIIGNLS